LIEGKVASRRPKRGKPGRFTNEQIARAVFQFQAAYPSWQQKKIKGHVADLFGVKYRHVYNVLKSGPHTYTAAACDPRKCQSVVPAPMARTVSTPRKDQPRFLAIPHRRAFC
jgi:transposase